jgi:hypothetical protein
MEEYRLDSDTLTSALHELEHIVDTVPGKLSALAAEVFDKSPAPGKWSPKEIIGHLIDSATNNHHRFVRGQFEERPLIAYDQEKWVDHNYYSSLPSRHVIRFWEMYNRHIVEVIKQMPEEQLQKECMMSDGSTRTIQWLFEDYVRHLEHHLRQVFPK